MDAMSALRLNEALAVRCIRLLAPSVKAGEVIALSKLVSTFATWANYAACRPWLRAVIGIVSISFVNQLERAMDLIRVLLSILLPPLGVFLQVGIGLHFWLNIVLTLLGYIPGIVHAIWIIARR